MKKPSNKNEEEKVVPDYTVVGGKRYDADGNRVYTRTPEQRELMSLAQRLRWAANVKAE
jgi:hypothetical protein